MLQFSFSANIVTDYAKMGSTMDFDTAKSYYANVTN